MTVYLIRTTAAGVKYWIIFDAEKKIARTTKKEAIRAWIDQYGTPAKIVRYSGILRPSEAVMTITEHQQGEGSK